MNLSRYSGYYAYGAALCAVFIWGAFPTLIKGTLQFTSVEQLLTLRFLVSTLIFTAIFPRIFKKVQAIPLLNWVTFIVTVIAVFYSQTYALAGVPASWYVAVFTFVPIIFMLIYKEPLSVMGFIGSALAVIGMMIFFISMHHEAKMSFWSVSLLLISVLAWVGYTFVAKKLHLYLEDCELVALTSLVGLLSSLVIWSAHGFHVQCVSLSGLSLCVLAGIILPLALVTYSFSLRFKPVFAVFSQYLEPIIGLGTAALFLGERMNLLQYTAALIVIVGTILVGVATRKG